MTIHLCSRPGSVNERTALSLRDLAPGGVCLAIPVARDAGALLPHRFTLTDGGETDGGLISVALSCESPRLAQASTLSYGAPTFLNPEGSRSSSRLPVTVIQCATADADPGTDHANGCGEQSVEEQADDVDAIVLSHIDDDADDLGDAPRNECRCRTVYER